MKYEVNEFSTEEITTTIDAENEKDLALDENSTALIFQLLSRSIYSNPIGSIVREITSNCFDSHVEAEVDTPVIIKKTIDSLTNVSYISFIDFGIGMSPDRIEKVFNVLLKSTKRHDNKQIGAYGLGSKTPLAYRRSTGNSDANYDNTYYIITIYDGIKYTYQIYEGENKLPKNVLLHTEPTSEHNGTEVKVPMLEKDYYRFQNELVRQLFYFENIIFEGFERDTLNNDFQIIRGKSFLFRGSEYGSSIHACIGKVAYPIDYDALGLSASDYNIPVAIRLEIGDIIPNASRENLEYNENVINVLKAKLEEVKAEILELLINQSKSIVTLEDYFKSNSKLGYLYFNNGKSINCNGMIKIKDIDLTNFKYNFTKMPDDKTLFSLFFNTKLYGKKIPLRKSYNSNTKFVGSYEEVQKNDNIYLADMYYERKPIKQAWLKAKHVRYYHINKTDIRFRTKDISYAFNIDAELLIAADGKFTPFMKNIADIQEEYYQILVKHVPNYNDIEVPEEFIQSRRTRKAPKEIRNQTIPVTIVNGYGSANTIRVKLDKLFKFRYSIYFGTKDDYSRMSSYAKVFNTLFNGGMVVDGYDEYHDVFNKDNRNGGIMFIMLAKNNLKFMRHCMRATSIHDFYDNVLSRKEKVIKNYFQSKLVANEYYDADIDRLYFSNGFQKLSKSWGSKVKKVTDFINDIPKLQNERIIDGQAHIYKSLYNINGLVPSKKQQKIIDVITEIKELEKRNADVMNYVNIPYDYEKKADFWVFLSKVMDLN